MRRHPATTPRRSTRQGGARLHEHRTGGCRPHAPRVSLSRPPHVSDALPLSCGPLSYTGPRFSETPIGLSFPRTSHRCGARSRFLLPVIPAASSSTRPRPSLLFRLDPSEEGHSETERSNPIDSNRISVVIRGICWEVGICYRKKTPYCLAVRVRGTDAALDLFS
jgi:hypothetical protein